MKYSVFFYFFILMLAFNTELICQNVYRTNSKTNLSNKSEFSESLTLNKSNYKNYLNSFQQIYRKKIITNTLLIEDLNISNTFVQPIRIKVEKALFIKNCNWADVFTFLNIIDTCSNLEKVVFENIKFANSKEIILKFKNIKILVFNKCDSLHNKTILNKICRIKRISKIDLSDNNLITIPDFKDFSVDTFLINKNTGINILNEKKRLPYSIKYLIIDKTPPTKNYDFQNMFNGTKIILDTTAVVNISINESKKKHGVFKITKQEQVLYSGAYTQFARILQSNPFQLNIDTILYDQRFDNLLYKRLIKNNTSVHLYTIKVLSKRYNKHISFEMIDFKKDKYLYKRVLRDFPEYYLFKKLIWVYEKPIKKSDFIKLYRKRKWYDYKILYNDQSNVFTIIFKDDTSFFSIEAKPVFSKDKNNQNKLLENYRKLFLSYSKKTEMRKHKFNRKIANEYQVYKRASDRYKDSCWVIFSRMYLSENEKDMTREEWLGYYENILSDERNILNHSTTMQTTLNRALDLIGFSNDSKNFTSQTSNIRFRLTDQDKGILAVNNASIIDLQNLNYFNFYGGLGYSQANIFLNPSGKYVIYAELINGDIAIVKPEDFVFNPNESSSDMLFKALVIRKELSSLEQVLSYFGLKL